ncbi:MAG: 23S rRNA (guanosine(2251)-2'-O)-methyltransferase RlmB [PVC group bacterium]
MTVSRRTDRYNPFCDSRERTMFLYGKNSVIERLKANPGSIKKIYLRDNLQDPELTGTVQASGIPVEFTGEKEMNRIRRTERRQVIAAEVEDYRYTPYPELVRNGKYPGYTLLFLDRISDPQNLGSIIRTAACFGGFAVVLPRHESCGVTETVLHVASGGENYVPAAMVTNLSRALREAKENGFWAAGAVPAGGTSLFKADLPFPLCLVIGSEGTGIRYGLDKHLDAKITLPMEGASLSFNASTAAAIFCYEIVRQRAGQ